MSHKKFLAALLACLCSPLLLAAADVAQSSTIEDSLPQWLDVAASVRFRAEGHRGVSFESDDARGFLLQRYRFSSAIHPTNWLKVFGEIQDSREAGSPRPGANFKDSVDLRQVWVSIGTESGPFDLKVGRQPLAFGRERIVGAGEWGNVPRVFDAVRLGIHRGSDRLDVFTSSVIHGDTGVWNDHHVKGDNLHGAYGSVGSILPSFRIEPYLLLRTSPQLSAYDGGGHLRSWTYGLRAADQGSSPWGYEVEIDGQRGEIGSNDLRSWAFSVEGRHRWESRTWQPTAIAEFNFASGDRQQGDGRVGTFDQLYPTNHGKYGIVDIVGRRNTKNVRAGVLLHPNKDLSIRIDGHSFWLANRFDALYSGGAAAIGRVEGGASTTDVGRELDFMGDLKLSNHYSVGLQVGHFFAGQFVKRYSPGAGSGFYTLFVVAQI